MKSFFCPNNFVIALDLQKSCSEERKKYSKPKLLQCWKQPHLKSRKVILPSIPCVCCLSHSLSPNANLFAFIRFPFLSLFTSVLQLCTVNLWYKKHLPITKYSGISSHLCFILEWPLWSHVQEERRRSCCLLWLMLHVIECGVETLFSYDCVKALQKREGKIKSTIHCVLWDLFQWPWYEFGKNGPWCSHTSHCNITPAWMETPLDNKQMIGRKINSF